MRSYKVTVIGAGAIGGLFAGWLGALDNPQIKLSVIARGQTLNALRTHGLRLIEEHANHTVMVNATDDSSSLGFQDLVILSVKSPALEQVVPHIQTLMGPNTLLLVAMNGVPWWFFDGFGGQYAGLTLRAVDPKGELAKKIPTSQVVGAVLHTSASTDAPGVIRHIAGNNLIIGMPSPDRVDQLTALGDLLQSSGWNITLSERIQKNIWYKLWGNMTMNPVSAITGVTCDLILDDPLVRAFCSSVMLEAKAIGNQIGCSIEQEPEERHDVTRRLGAFKTSMLQDVEGARPLEIDALVGVVSEIGHHVGIATPNIDALLGLVRLMAKGRGLYSNK